MDLMIQQGWQCPCCRRIYSPTTPMCYYCPPTVETAQNTSPPQRQWVGLTEDDWDEIFGNALTIGEAIKVTEAKLKEKNT